MTVLDVRAWAEQGSLYAILDACDTPTVLEKVRQLGPQRAVSLYAGKAETDFEIIAPYLVRVDGATLDWIVGSLWSEPWGILARGVTDLESLRKHFRQFLIVESPEGEAWYFRFYDPRVLKTYLPACTAEEYARFIGPLTHLAITDAETYGIEAFSAKR